MPGIQSATPSGSAGSLTYLPPSGPLPLEVVLLGRHGFLSWSWTACLPPSRGWGGEEWELQQQHGQTDRVEPAAHLSSLSSFPEPPLALTSWVGGRYQAYTVAVVAAKKFSFLHYHYVSGVLLSSSRWFIVLPILAAQKRKGISSTV